MKAKDRIIFPLDFADLEEASYWVALLKDFVGIFKVGLELFTSFGPKAIQKIREITDLPIFLDLKLCDIPNTVAQAVKAAKNLEVDFLTIHCLSGRQALQKAISVAEGKLKILGVTLLTSLDKADLLELGFNGELVKETEELVLRYAILAESSGCYGVILSGKEVKRVKESLPNLRTVVPGIRWEEENKGDQLRTTTPLEAILNGADYLVIGRPIRMSPDPLATCKKIIAEIEEGERLKNDR